MEVRAKVGGLGNGTKKPEGTPSKALVPAKKSSGTSKKKKKKSDREKGLNHAWWLAQNHPERWEALTASLLILQSGSDADKIRLGQLWSRPSENPAVLANADQMMQALGRPFEAEDYLQRARKLAPGKSSGLETLYARALRRSPGSDRDDGLR